MSQELEIDSEVYWVAIWSDPRVRNLLSTSHIGGSQVGQVLRWDKIKKVTIVFGVDIIYRLCMPQIINMYECSLQTDLIIVFNI